MALSVYVFLAFDKTQAGLQFVEKVPWMESLGIQYFNAADGFNLPLILLTGIVHFTGVLTMWELEERVKEFFAFYFVLVTGVFGFFMSMDLFFTFVWYDVSLFPMYPLIAIWGSTRKEYGAMKLFLYLLAGSALILPVFIYLFAKSGLNSFDVVALMQPRDIHSFSAEIRFHLSLFGFRHSCRRVALSHVVAHRPCGCTHFREYASCRRAHEARGLRYPANRYLRLP